VRSRRGTKGQVRSSRDSGLAEPFGILRLRAISRNLGPSNVGRIDYVSVTRPIPAGSKGYDVAKKSPSQSRGFQVSRFGRDQYLDTVGLLNW
jgi:hypothetical protein